MFFITITVDLHSSSSHNMIPGTTRETLSHQSVFFCYYYYVVYTYVLLCGGVDSLSCVSYECLQVKYGTFKKNEQN